MLVILFAVLASERGHLQLSEEALAGFTVSLRFDEDLPGTIFIPGCGAVEFERLDGDRWVPVTGAPCDRAAPAEQIDTSRVLTVNVPGSGTWRAVVGWGSECVAGRPFVLAACKHLDVIRSEPVVVP